MARRGVISSDSFVIETWAQNTWVPVFRLLIHHLGGIIETDSDFYVCASFSITNCYGLLWCWGWDTSGLYRACCSILRTLSSWEAVVSQKKLGWVHFHIHVPVVKPTFEILVTGLCAYILPQQNDRLHQLHIQYYSKWLYILFRMGQQGMNYFD